MNIHLTKINNLFSFKAGMNNRVDMSKNNPWIVRKKNQFGHRYRMFCFPFAGGSSTIFHEWPTILTRNVEVCAIQLPGRGTRIMEEPYSNLKELTIKLADVLTPYLDMPYILYGHSMGSMITFELTRELRRRGLKLPVKIIVSGRRGPQVPARTKSLHDLPDDEFVEGLKNYNGTPAQVFESKELMELFLPILRADFTVNGTYEYYDEEPFDIPLSVYGGTDDHLANQEELNAWKEHTTKAFSLQMMEGNHFFIQGNRDEFLKLLNRELLLLP